ncbi:MAG: peptidylprolyl isomerase [Phototrophicales bacterium]
MAKRRPIPKAKPPVQPQEEAGKKPLREFQSRAEREAYLQRQIVLWTSVAIGVIAVIIMVAFFINQVIVPNRNVAKVNGVNINVGDFQDRIRLERVLSSEKISISISQVMNAGITDINQAFSQVYQRDQDIQQRWNELNAPDQMGLRIINDMIDEKIIRDEAARRGITVTQDEINAQVLAFLQLPQLEAPAEVDPETTPEPEPSATPSPTPLVTATPSPIPTATNTPEFTPTPSLTPAPTATAIPTLPYQEQLENQQDLIDDFYSYVSRRAGVSREQIDAYFEYQALRMKLGEAVTGVGDTAIWVNARHILVETEAEALDIIEALNNGESFADLARLSSTDTASGAQGGELGWSNTNGFVEPFGEATRTLEIGAISEPIETEFGFHIIQVRAREDREMGDREREFIIEREFETWLEEFRNNTEVNTFETSNSWPDYVPTEPEFEFRRRL